MSPAAKIIAALAVISAGAAGVWAWIRFGNPPAILDFGGAGEEPDDEELGGEPKPKPKPKPEPKTKAEPKKGDVPHVGNPANLSGNSKGYNTKMFPNFSSVNAFLNKIGVSAPSGEKSPNGAVMKKFQRQYNAISHDIANGVLTAPVNIRGTLQVDGKWGPNSANALEAAVVTHANQLLGFSWAAEAKKRGL